LADYFQVAQSFVKFKAPRLEKSGGRFVLPRRSLGVGGFGGSMGDDAKSTRLPDICNIDQILRPAAPGLVLAETILTVATAL